MARRLASAVLAAAPTCPARLNELKRELNSVADGFHGVLGYSLHHLKSGDRLDTCGVTRICTRPSGKILGTTLSTTPTGW